MAVTALQTDYEEMMQTRPSLMMVELHDEAIEALQAVVAAISSGEIETRFHETAAAMEAVTALYAMLDHENGGELASNLGAVYRDVMSKLARISFSSDPALARDSIDLLRPLRDAWSGLDRRAHGEAPPVNRAQSVVKEVKAMKSKP